MLPSPSQDKPADPQLMSRVRCGLIQVLSDISKIQALHLSVSVCFPSCASLSLRLDLPLWLQPRQGQFHPLHRKMKVLDQILTSPDQPFTVVRGTGLTDWLTLIRTYPVELRWGKPGFWVGKALTCYIC